MDKLKNIARIANAVHCHSWFSCNKDCHEFRFSIVRIVISVSIVTSHLDCFKTCKSKTKRASHNVWKWTNITLKRSTCISKFIKVLDFTHIYFTQFACTRHDFTMHEWFFSAHPPDCYLAAETQRILKAPRGSGRIKAPPGLGLLPAEWQTLNDF